jgi:hypothetical protein
LQLLTTFFTIVNIDPNVAQHMTLQSSSNQKIQN